MKRQINTVSNWSVKGIITVTILSAMLCTFGAKASNKPTVALNSVTAKMESKNGIEKWKNSNAGTNTEVVEKYNAEGFVKAEIALEIESWMNSNTEINSEVVKAEATPQIEALMNSNQYTAKKYVEAEMVLEIKSWMNNSCF